MEADIDLNSMISLLREDKPLADNSRREARGQKRQAIKAEKRGGMNKDILYY